MASGAWAAHIFATAVVCLVMMVAAPRFIEFFSASDADLPAATILVVNLSNYFVNFYYTLAVPLALDAALLVGFNLAAPRFSWLGRVWSALVLLFAVLLLGFSFLAISFGCPVDAPIQIAE
ncbi:MAG TPA: hypothetical protein VFW87_01945 [Pirellulales bacterium]|nr:hypothetical protein [Pirellulales bacterium]